MKKLILKTPWGKSEVNAPEQKEAPQQKANVIDPKTIPPVVHQLWKYLEIFKPAGLGARPTPGKLNKNLTAMLRGAGQFFNTLRALCDLLNLKLNDFEIISTDQELTEFGVFLEKYRSDKVQSMVHEGETGFMHRYDLIYSDILDEFKNKQNINILEIGIGTANPNVPSNVGAQNEPGAFLLAASEYIPEANIHGADVDKSVLFEAENIKTAYVDQLAPTTFRKMHEELGSKDYDLIIEDGLHSVTASLNTLIWSVKNLKKGGLLVMEDLYNPYGIWRIISTLINLHSKDLKSRLYNCGGNLIIVEKL